MSKSPNHYNGRNGWKPDMICVHVTEGGFSGAVSWLCNPTAQASAHFVVGANGQKEQLLDFKDGAWCNGNTTDPNSRLYYKKSLNAIVQGRATNANYYTYSIEHEGYSYKERYGALTEAQYQASLEVMKLMISDMKNTYGVTFQPDRDHLIGHYAIDPTGKPSCPAPNQGANFPFDRFIADIRAWMGIGAPAQPAPAPQPAAPSPAPSTGINAGDKVKLSADATYYDGKAIPSWVKGDTWIASSVKGDRAVIDKNVAGTNSICSPINTKFLTVAGTTATAPAAPSPAPAPTIAVGSRVKVKAGAKSYNGASIASFVFNNTYTVDELKGDRAVLDLKGICAAFKTSDLILQ